MKVPAKALVPLLLIVVIAFFWVWSKSDVNDRSEIVAPAVEQQAEHTQAIEPNRQIEQPSTMVGKHEGTALPDTLPSSLAGTTVPAGWAKVDSTGALVPTPELRQMFEYYLSALGEESLQQLVTRIENTLSGLDEPARSQALETLGTYLDYKLAVADLEAAYSGTGPLDASQMQQRMKEIQALRRTWMDSETVAAFFSQDEAIDDFQVERARIVQNDDLTDEQRQAAIVRAEAALPPPLRKAREQTRRFSDYEKARREYADDPAALEAWRTEHFDAGAAERLAELDQKQQAWDRRWQDYSDERKSLMSSGLAGPDLDTALERLRTRYFNDTEQIRARALDSIR